MRLVIRKAKQPLAPWLKGDPYDVVLIDDAGGARKIDALSRTLDSARERAAEFALGRNLEITEE